MLRQADACVAGAINSKCNGGPDTNAYIFADAYTVASDIDDEPRRNSSTRSTYCGTHQQPDSNSNLDNSGSHHTEANSSASDANTSSNYGAGHDSQSCSADHSESNASACDANTGSDTVTGHHS